MKRAGSQTRRAPPAAAGQTPGPHGPTLDLLPAHAAVLDRHGVIRSANRAWGAFARENGLAAPDGGRGLGYLAVRDAAARDPGPAAGEAAGHARAVAAGLRAVLAGGRETFEHGPYPAPCRAAGGAGSCSGRGRCPAGARWCCTRTSPSSTCGRGGRRSGPCATR